MILQHLGNSLGVFNKVKDELSKLETDDSGTNRGIVMSEILSTWINLPDSKHHHSPDGHSLARGLEAARLNQHAEGETSQPIRTLN